MRRLIPGRSLTQHSTHTRQLTHTLSTHSTHYYTAEGPPHQGYAPSRSAPEATLPENSLHCAAAEGQIIIFRVFRYIHTRPDGCGGDGARKASRGGVASTVSCVKTVHLWRSDVERITTTRGGAPRQRRSDSNNIPYEFSRAYITLSVTLS